MKIAITGATGFLGGALARRLLQEGHTVRALVRTTSIRQPLADLPIEWVEGDVTQMDSLASFVMGVDWIVHAAGLLGKAGVPEAEYERINVTGSHNILRAISKQTTPPHLLHVSSAGVLGPLQAGQTAASADESAPLAPSNAYERSKAQAERLAQYYAQHVSLPVVIVRPEFVYGPGDHHVLGLFKTIQKRMFFYIGDGHNTCHPTYIDDTIAGMIAIINKGKVGETYHITGPRPLSFRELANTIAGKLGVSPPWLQIPHSLALLGAITLEKASQLTGIHAPLSRTGVAFFSEQRGSTYAKAKQQLGYVPQVDLDAGITQTVVWYQEQGLL